MTEADSYDEADEGEETRVVIQYRRSTKVAGKGSCIRLGVSGICATASAFLIGGHFNSLFISFFYRTQVSLVRSMGLVVSKSLRDLFET